MVEVAHHGHDPAELFQRVGLTTVAEDPTAAGQSIDDAAYYDLLEHIAGDDDHGFPLRYAEALKANDLGALGLAMRTAPTVEGVLDRLMRYILILSDTLEYEFSDAHGGRMFKLTGRPHHSRGLALANECALAAIVSVVRQSAGPDITPVRVTFRHSGPRDDRHHVAFFACPVWFGADVNGLELRHADLARPTLLADDGLSSYLLRQLDDLKASHAARSIVDDVRAAVADSLPDGQPSKGLIARRLGMSERTLHRHLADRSTTFQTITAEARRDAARSLLKSTSHSLAEVAFLTGFADQTAFTRAFKRWTDQTPAAYRAGVA